MNIDQGLKTAANRPIESAAPRSDLLRSDVPIGFVINSKKTGILGLSKFEIKCILLELAYISSNYDTEKWIGDTVDTAAFYGRYQTSRELLKRYNYIDAESNTWTGKDGIFVATEFLSSAGFQDSIMKKFLEEAYDALILNGGVRVGDSIDTVAGMLMVAYQFSNYDDYALKASLWRLNGVESDSQKRPGYIYYNAGRYAVVTLAADTNG